MPSASTSTLRRPSASRSSLSHSTIVRSSIAVFITGTTSSSRSRVMTKPPLCWVRWRGKPISSFAISSASCERRIGGIEPDRAHAILADRRCLLAPGGSVESGDHIVGEAEDLGRFADRRARAVGDHRGGEAGALAAVSLVDVLDHLFAPLVLEVDVDVGRLVALGRDEALEQQIEARRIDLGDPEAIADRGIGRRAAALAEDALRAREAHDVVHGEEVRRVIERGDQLEFIRQRFSRALRNALGIARFRALPGESLERLLRRRHSPRAALPDSNGTIRRG